ncbi:MAG: hypothetical protein RBT05_06760 [Bacteroidales bacterium]|jgi:hypothetical protein|nr:hypothetical protein [Bacteroidales bacterium]
MMKKKHLIGFFIGLLFSIGAYSQKDQTFAEFESQMKELLDQAIDSPKDNERYNANERLLTIMEEVLNMEKSFSHPFASLNRISNLKSADNKFRILTWAVKNQEGSFENFGFVQAKNETSDEYEVYILKDKSEEIFNPELTKTDNQMWFGAVYYELLTMEYEGRKVYTLLGYDGNNLYTKRKIIDFISFKTKDARPYFGQNVFHKDRDRYRYIFEYNPDANFFLLWDNQYYEDTKASKRQKKSRRTRITTNEPNLIQEYMIVYDVLEPMFEGMEGSTKAQFYVSSGYVNGFKFERGRWRLVENVQPRNSKPEPKIKQKAPQIPLYKP